VLGVHILKKNAILLFMFVVVGVCSE